MNKSIFDRMVAPIKRKISRIFSVGILKILDNSGYTQLIQATFLSGEVISDLRRLQEYGFASFPYSDTEVLSIFANGNRDQGIAFCIHDRDKRPIDLVEGEVAVYGPDDINSNQRIHFKANGSTVIDGSNNVTLNAVNNVNINSTKKVDITANTNVNIISTTGNVSIESTAGDVIVEAGNTVKLGSGATAGVIRAGDETDVNAGHKHPISVGSTKVLAE